jgi:predicted TIM-barrel fold metal-dependent hydrolase
MNIASVISRENVNDNPAAFVAKAEFPNRFYVFAGLDHPSPFTAGAASTPPLAEQVDRLLALGADGVKMIETKPDYRKSVDVPVDSKYYKDYFRRLEGTGLPILWHVADPEEFWDQERTPNWAKVQGWDYDDTFISYQRLYEEVERVLERHPQLKVIFAHFFFLSANLQRAGEIFDRHPGVHFDLAPGIELLYNLSKDPAAAREFFIKYSDRILYGTDITSGQNPDEARIRAGIIKRWLETDEEYRLPEGADFLLGPPEDGVIRGLRLPADALENIYHANFDRLAGAAPRPLNLELAALECERIAHNVSRLSGRSTKDTPASAASARLSDLV